MYKNYKKMKRKFIPEKKVKTLGSQSTFQEKLDAMESIRNDLGTDGIEVPGVVVAGSQSSGKSSVLESLSGIRLPSGTTITTRVPLILRLERRPVQKSFAIIHDTADLTHGEHIDELDDIPSKIEEYTKRIAGDGGSVLDNPIHLKVIQSDGPTITIIDLPGITHMSIDDVQKDIHAQTVNLVKKYIQNEHMIILCVVPALDDFANSEAIKLSKEIDVNGKRTIGVITKIDLCPDDITDKIQGTGRNVPLSLGYVAVRNRAPKESEISTKELRKLERQFFQQSGFYSTLEQSSWGMDTLIDKIIDLQAASIDTYIPKVVDTLNNRINTLKQELLSDEYHFATTQDKYRYITKCVLKISENMGALRSDKDLYTMFMMYGQNIKSARPHFFDDEFYERLKKDVKDIAGVSLPNFLSQPLFENIMKDTRNDVIDISNRLTVDVYVHMKQMIKNEVKNITGDISQFIYNTMIQDLEELRENMTSVINTFLEAEHIVFTQNNGYINDIKCIRAMAVNNDNDTTDIPDKFLKRYASSTIGNETHMVCELQASLYSYTNVYINRLGDTIPMLLMHFIRLFVNRISQKTMEPVNDDVIEKYMADDEKQLKEREKKEGQLSRFEKALKLLYSL